MKVLVQRVIGSSVEIDGKTNGIIENGLLLLVGFTYGDSIDDIDYMVNKIVNLRIFEDEDGVMNKSVIDTNGSILSISQFTLYADTKKGNRPSYIGALKSSEATILYDEFNRRLGKFVNVQKGIFGSHMIINSVMCGPVTIMLESRSEND